MTTFNDRRSATTKELSTLISGEEPHGSNLKFFAANTMLNSYGLSGGSVPKRSETFAGPIKETTSIVDMR